MNNNNTYYQQNRGRLLGQANKYCENKERSEEQVPDKYRELSNEKRI